MQAKWNNPYEVLGESQDIWEAIVWEYIDNATVVITTFEHNIQICLWEKPLVLLAPMIPLEFFTFLNGKD